MQKLIHSISKNYVTLFKIDGSIEISIDGITSVDPEGGCFVVKKIIGKDPRPNAILMVPISNTNLYIER